MELRASRNYDKSRFHYTASITAIDTSMLWSTSDSCANQFSQFRGAKKTWLQAVFDMISLCKAMRCNQLVKVDDICETIDRVNVYLLYILKIKTHTHLSCSREWGFFGFQKISENQPFDRIIFDLFTSSLQDDTYWKTSSTEKTPRTVALLTSQLSPGSHLDFL